MDFIDLEQFRKDKLKDIAAGRFDAPLAELTQIAELVLNNPRAQSKVFSSAILDDVAAKIGHAAWASNAQKPQPQTLDEAQRPWLFIATYMYPAGGHTKVMEDYIKLADGRPCVVLLTNLANGDPEVHRGQLYVDEVNRLGAMSSISTSGGLTDKLNWLQHQIATLNPAKTFLFNHFYDSVALAASVVAPAGTGYFLHHSDYKFSLGVQAAHLNHIDFHPAGLCLCRDKLKVPNQVYWPLSATDSGIRGDNSFYKNGRFTTASSGAPLKYDAPYPYSYFDLIAPIICATDGMHVHIGDLNVEQLARIHNGLAQNGVPLERFVHVPVVKSVWQAMTDYGVDVYLPSFPTGGNKATIEAMGSGTPVVSHLGMGAYRFILGGDFIMYPEVLRWKHPDELFAVLQHMNRIEVLTQHRVLARGQYDSSYAEHFTHELIQHPERTFEAKNHIAIDTVDPVDLQDFLFNEHFVG